MSALLSAVFVIAAIAATYVLVSTVRSAAPAWLSLRKTFRTAESGGQVTIAWRDPVRAQFSPLRPPVTRRLRRHHAAIKLAKHRMHNYDGTQRRA